MPDVVDVIMADHREVKRLFDVLEKHPERRSLELPVLTTLLVAHSRAEEAEVYPAARTEASETDEVAHARPRSGWQRLWLTVTWVGYSPLTR